MPSFTSEQIEEFEVRNYLKRVHFYKDLLLRIQRRGKRPSNIPLPAFSKLQRDGLLLYDYKTKRYEVTPETEIVLKAIMDEEDREASQ